MDRMTIAKNLKRSIHVERGCTCELYQTEIGLGDQTEIGLSICLLQSTKVVMSSRVR